MHFEQIYLDCLAQASYLIGDAGTAAVVDPRRDIGAYLDRARELGLSIEHVIATHVHADFVAGLRELAERTGATIHMGRRFDGELPCEPFGDGDEIRFGSVSLRALETPGHTPESICVLVTEAGADTPARLLTGDTLFIGDVGRPDLAGSRGFSSQDMAAMMYDSLREKILPLPDEVEVHPGHGAGSACGKNISCESWSTIGRQRLQNWAFADRPKDEFVGMMTTDLAPPPRYFAHAAALNRAGPRLTAELPELRALSVAELDAAVADGAVLLDVRSFAEYGERHLDSSLNIGLDGNFASWCGSLIPPEQPIVVVAADEPGAREARMRLARVGLENVRGYLLAEGDGALAAGRAFGCLPQLSVGQLHARLARRDGWQVVDVRRPGEYRAGHVPGARHAPLDRLPVDGEVLDGLDRPRPTAVICARGYRSSAACRYLRALGFEDLYNVVGGTGAWVAAGFEVEK